MGTLEFHLNVRRNDVLFTVAGMVAVVGRRLAPEKIFNFMNEKTERKLAALISDVKVATFSGH